jgi:hypothetical protein
MQYDFFLFVLIINGRELEHFYYLDHEFPIPTYIWYVSRWSRMLTCAQPFRVVISIH